MRARRRMHRLAAGGGLMLLVLLAAFPAGAVTAIAPYDGAQCGGVTGEDSMNQIVLTGQSGGSGGASSATGAINVHSRASDDLPAGVIVSPPQTVGPYTFSAIGYQSYTHICKFTQILPVTSAGTRTVTITFDQISAPTTGASATGIPVHPFVSYAESRVDANLYAYSFPCSPGQCAPADFKHATQPVVHTELNSGNPLSNTVSVTTSIAVVGAGHVYVEAHLAAQSRATGRWNTSADASARLKQIVVS